MSLCFHWWGQLTWQSRVQIQGLWLHSISFSYNNTPTYLACLFSLLPTFPLELAQTFYKRNILKSSRKSHEFTGRMRKSGQGLLKGICWWSHASLQRVVLLLVKICFTTLPLKTKNKENKTKNKNQKNSCTTDKE